MSLLGEIDAQTIALAEMRSGNYRIDRDGRPRYLHALPGRVRIEIPALRENPRSSSRIKMNTAAIPGVQQAEISRISRRMLINYDPSVIDLPTLMREMSCIGCFAVNKGRKSGRVARDVAMESSRPLRLHPTSELLLKAVVEILAKSLVEALLAPLL